MKTFNFNERTAMVQADGCTAARQKIGVNPTKTPTFARFASSLCLILTMLFTLGVGEMGAKIVYCKMAKSWWTADGAAVAAYAWKSSDESIKNAEWPGTRMNAVGDNLWSLEIDDSKYDKVIFTRVNNSGAVSYWNAKTANLNLSSANASGANYYNITSSSDVWDPSTCTGSWTNFSGTHTFEAGTTIYFDFTALDTGSKTGVNWYNGSVFWYDGSGAGSLQSVTFASTTALNTELWFMSTDRGGWSKQKFTAPSAGQNIVKIASDGKSFTWGAAEIALAGGMNDWSTTANTSTTGSVEIDLDAHKTYQFKMVFKGDGGDKYCGMGSTWITSSVSNYGCYFNGGDNIFITTAGEGTYTFAYDLKSNNLSVTYPTVTHPTIDYVYCQNYSWNNTYLQLWSSASSATETGYPGQNLYPTTMTTTIGGTSYFFAAAGDYGNLQFSDGSGNNSGSLTTNFGHYARYSSGWGWGTWNFAVTLQNQVTTTSAPSNPSVQFNGDAPSDLTAPACSFYTFGGYYTAAGGGGSQVITAAGKWNASVSGYTDGSKKWIHEGGAATLYGKWTQSIALNQNGATTDGSTSLAATYNAVLDASGITNPSKTGYTFDGWTTAQNSGSVVINASKAVQTVASWTDGSKKWIHNAASTLYAKWTAIDYNVTYSAPSNGNYTIKVASGTASSASKTANYGQTITLAATPTTGYHFVSWTIKKTSDNSDVTSSVSLSSSTNKDATFTMPAYGVTVTATFAIDTYAITYAAGTYGSGSLVGGTKTYGVSYTLSSSSSAFTRTGYTYDGWSTNAAGSSKDYNLGGSYTTNAAQTFYPHWVVTNYTISYDLAGGSVATPNPTSYTVESSAITLNNPTKTGYTFAVWTGTGLASATTTVTIAAGSTGNRSYTATWTANTNTAYTVKHYQQNLDGTYPSTPTETQNLTGTTAASVTPAVKSYTGFTSPSTQTVTILADGSLVVTYQYTRNSYTLTWALNGGSISSAGTAAGSVKYGASLTAPTVTKAGYEFASWSPSVPATMPAANSTYTATWTEKTYNVTFYNGDHGTVKVDGATISNGGTASVNHFTTKTLVATANTGYKFTEWTNTGSVTIGNTANASTTITATATGGTVTATWTAKQCTVTFNKNGGEGGDDNATATYGSAMTNVSVPHKIGYKFAGYWDGTGGTGNQYYKADGTSYTNWNKDIETPTTLYAKWTSDTNTFTGATNTDWATGTNWSKGSAPTDDYSTVDIHSNVIIADGTTAHVGEIVLTAGTLTIQPGGALEVAGTIKKSNGDPTETTDIIINTSDTKQASLILDNSAADTKATVLVTSTAAKVEDTYSFQYIAVPMTSVSVQHSFSGQGIYTYAWNEGTGWERRNYYYDLYAFEGVGLTQASASGYGLTGTLATTNNQTFALTYTSETAGAGMNMIGNSWTSPISIAALHGKITGNATSTVYVYDSKTGEWPAYPTGSAGTAVVPAMQAYLILATSGGGSLQLNYDEAVRGVASANRTPALRAPKREIMEMSDIYLHVSDNNVSTDLRLCEAEQFTNAFDNGWEAIYIEGEGRSGQLYAQTDEKMAVLATPSLEGTVVGFIPGNAANYTISFSGTETGYYLNDMLMEQSTLITEGNTYEFVPDENTNATRFVISKTPIMKTPTGVEDNEQTEINNVRKLIINDKLYIIRAGRIYNATGALVK